MEWRNEKTNFKTETHRLGNKQYLLNTMGLTYHDKDGGMEERKNKFKTEKPRLGN